MTPRYTILTPDQYEILQIAGYPGSFTTYHGYSAVDYYAFNAWLQDFDGEGLSDDDWDEITNGTGLVYWSSEYIYGF